MLSMAVVLLVFNVDLTQTDAVTLKVNKVEEPGQNLSDGIAENSWTSAHLPLSPRLIGNVDFKFQEERKEMNLTWGPLLQELGLLDHEDESEEEDDYDDDENDYGDYEGDDEEEETPEWKAFKERAGQQGYVLTEPKENPSAALVVVVNGSSGEYPCSGTLVAKRWVLTAGHCFEGINVTVKNQAVVLAGAVSYSELNYMTFSPGCQVRLSRKVIVHPNFPYFQRVFDVALVKVRVPFTMTTTVRLAKLSASEWTYGDIKHCKFTGFGMVQKGEVHKDDWCRKTQTFDLRLPCPCNLGREFYIDKGYAMCNYRAANGLGLCGGDSGAGLFCGKKLWAVARSGFTSVNLYICDLHITKDNLCATNHTVSIFVPIYHNLDFISHYVKRVPLPSGGCTCKAQLLVVLLSSAAVSAVTVVMRWLS